MVNKNLKWIVLVLIALLLIFLNLILGSVQIPPSEITSILLGGESERSSWKYIILDLRLPRALTALLAGMGLSISGLQMQTLFKNPLAGPFVLGISSGASLGVAILILAGGGIFILGIFSSRPSGARVPEILADSRYV